MGYLKVHCLTFKQQTKELGLSYCSIVSGTDKKALWLSGVVL